MFSTTFSDYEILE